MRRTILNLSLAILSMQVIVSQTAYTADDKPAVPETSAQKAERMKWWSEARFGMFIHWGPVSIKGTEIGWSRGGERRGVGGTGEIPLDVYDNLYKQFNPTKYNADEWVKIAKAAGMKYMVFTTRHHDGFSEWDSKVSDYNIMHSPYGKDIVKQLADACHKAGVKLGFYYSQPDWHNADYLTATHSKYLEYMKGQIRELLTNYGKVDVIWFDGLQGNADTWDAPNTIAMIRKLQPGIIINNRCGLPEDFDTPEQYVGGFQMNRPWESCITICNQWAYRPDDGMKSLKQCLQTLIGCAGGDGNLLFNVGPMPTGEIEPRQVERLKEMGEWLKKYGESIYGTRGGPFKPSSSVASTRKGNVIYVHVLKQMPELTLSPIPVKIKSVSLLTGGSVIFNQTDDGISIKIPADSIKDIDTIIKLTLEGSAMGIEAVPATRFANKLPKGTKVTASNVFMNQIAEHGPEKAFDGDTDTRWATDLGTKQSWIALEYPQPMKISSISISEEYDRVQSFEVQYQDSSDWKTIFKGTTIGNSFKKDFEPVTAKAFRLNILDATDGPTFWEIGLK